MANAAQGYAAHLAADPVAIDTESEPYEFTECTIAKTQNVIETNGIRGTRSRPTERARRTVYEVGGSFTTAPSPNDLAKWLPRILGGTPVATDYPLADVLPEFVLGVDRVSDAFTYSGCKVSRATFRGSSGGFIELAIEITGKAEADLVYPTLTLGTDPADDPFIFEEGAITLSGAAREITSFELIVDNVAQKRTVNSLTATSITASDRIVTLRPTVPYDSDHEDLYTQVAAGEIGQLSFTNGGLSLTFDFINLKPNFTSPPISGKNEIMFPHEYVARSSGATKELVTTLDITP